MNDCSKCNRKAYRRGMCRKCCKIEQRKAFHCTYKKCCSPVFASTLCQYHYRSTKTCCLKCTKPVFCRSLCRKHYDLSRLSDDFPEEPKCSKCNRSVYLQELCIGHFKKEFNATECIIIGCEKRNHKIGLCCKHYFQRRRRCS